MSVSLPRRTATDALMLLALRGSIMIAPLFAYPLYARALSSREMTLLGVAQGLATATSFVFEFGFAFTGIRAITLCSTEGTVRPRSVVITFICARAFITLSSLPFVLAVSLIYFRDAGTSIALTTVSLSIVLGWSPFWIYQGIGRLRVAVIIDGGIRVMTIAFSIVVAFTMHSAFFVIAMYVFASFVSAVILHLLAAHLVGGLSFTCSKKDVRHCIREAVPFFAQRISLSVYMQLPLLVLPLFVDARQAMTYVLADRLVKGMLVAQTSVSQAIYPRMCDEVRVSTASAWAFLIRAASVQVLLFCAGSAVVVALARPLGELALARYDPTFVTLLRLGAVYVICALLTNILSVQWAVPNGLDRAFPVLYLFGLVVLLGMIYLTQVVFRMDVSGFIVSSIVSELTLMLAFALLIRKNLPAWPWKIWNSFPMVHRT